MSQQAHATGPSFTHLTDWSTWNDGASQTFNGTYAVALNAAGDVYVVDSGNGRVVEFSSSGMYIREWNSWNDGSNQALDYPTGIAVNAAGDVYVAVEGRQRIVEFDGSGTYIREWSSWNDGSNQSFSEPFSVAVNAAGDVYVSDRDNNLISEFDGSGTYIREWNSWNDGSVQYFGEPGGMAVNAAGDVYIADYSASRMVEFTGSGSYITEWSSWNDGASQSFDHPLGVAVDASGSVYVSDTYNIRVVKFSSNGSYSTEWSSWSGGSSPQAFSNPYGLAVNANGDVYVADHDHSRIEVFGTAPAPRGSVSPIWYFAEGHVGTGFQEYLSIQNPDPYNACTVQIEYDRDQGNPITRMVTVPVNSRLSENVNQDLGVGPAASSGAQNVSTTLTVTNTVACAGVVAERPMYFQNVFGVSSGTDALGATRLNSRFYYADVSTLPGTHSFLTILNPSSNSQWAQISVTYYLGGQSLGTQSLNVPPARRGTIVPMSFGKRVAAVITSSEPVAVERPTYFSGLASGNAGTVSGAATLVASPEMNNDWLFAEGYTGSGFQENFMIANLDTTAAQVTIMLELTNGTTRQYTLTVNSQDMVNWDVNAHLPNQSLSAEITSTGGQIVVQREKYFQYHMQVGGRTQQVMGGTDMLGLRYTDSAYNFAEGYTNSGYNEWLTLQNPTNAVEGVVVTLVNGQGHSYAFSVSLAAHSRSTVNLTTVMQQQMCHAGAVSACYQMAFTVQASQNGQFVAERPMYFAVTGMQGGSDLVGFKGYYDCNVKRLTSTGHNIIWALC